MRSKTISHHEVDEQNNESLNSFTHRTFLHFINLIQHAGEANTDNLFRKGHSESLITLVDHIGTMLPITFRPLLSKLEIH